MNQSLLKGFTLVEVLSIITIVSVLSIVAIPRLTLFHSDLSQSKANLIHSLTAARKIAMFSSEQDGKVKFTLENNRINIRKGDLDLKHLGIDYSNDLRTDIEHFPKTLILNFNTFGETKESNVTLNLKGSTETIMIHSTGYVQ